MTSFTYPFKTKGLFMTGTRMFYHAAQTRVSIDIETWALEWRKEGEKDEKQTPSPASSKETSVIHVSPPSRVRHSSNLSVYLKAIQHIRKTSSLTSLIDKDPASVERARHIFYGLLGAVSSTFTIQDKQRRTKVLVDLNLVKSNILKTDATYSPMEEAAKQSAAFELQIYTTLRMYLFHGDFNLEAQFESGELEALAAYIQSLFLRNRMAEGVERHVHVFIRSSRSRMVYSCHFQLQRESVSARELESYSLPPAPSTQPRQPPTTVSAWLCCCGKSSVSPSPSPPDPDLTTKAIVVRYEVTFYDHFHMFLTAASRDLDFYKSLYDEYMSVVQASVDTKIYETRLLRAHETLESIFLE